MAHGNKSTHNILLYSTIWNVTGNCVEITTDKWYRYITSNSVPDFYMNPYCPIGIGFGYCTQYEIKHGTCLFPNLTCGEDNGPGTTPYGDVWIPLKVRTWIRIKKVLCCIFIV